MKYLISVFILLCSCCLLMSPASAATSSAAQQLLGLLQGINTLQADFQQTTQDGHGNVLQTATGHMALQRPGYFRWQLLQPMPQLLIAKQQRVWLYDPALQQVTIQNLNQQTGGAPALLLSGSSDQLLLKEFQISQIAPNAAQQMQFQLIPKQSDNVLQSLQLSFDGKRLVAMRFIDQLGHDTRINFQHVVVNGSLPANSFQFQPPPGTEVIDNTQL